jgi:hypothetical protein
VLSASSLGRHHLLMSRTWGLHDQARNPHSTNFNMLVQHLLPFRVLSQEVSPLSDFRALGPIPLLPSVVTHGPIPTTNHSKQCYGYTKVVTILPLTATAMRRHVTAPSISTLPSFYPNSAPVRPDINGCIPAMEHAHNYCPVLLP